MRRLVAVILLLGAAAPTIARQQPAAPTRRGAISGRIVDVYGDPVINAHVIVELRGEESTRRGVAAADTDDRGEYRVGHLAPGTYIVSMIQLQTVAMSPTGGRAPERTYYPGRTTDPSEAETIRLDAGDERDDVDFVAPAAPALLPPVVTVRMQQLAASGARPVAGSSIVRGRVTLPNGSGVSHARVLLVSDADPLQTRAGLSDADGRFEFREVAAGRFRVTASKAGFAPVTFPGGPGVIGGMLGDSRNIEIAAGDSRDAIDLHLARFGAVSGRVVNDAGEPVEGASVQVLQLRYEAGRRRLTPAPAVARPTNDLGRYRLFGIGPGQYVVSAFVAGGRTGDAPGYAPSYYPGTANPAGAQFVSIGAAQDIDGIDIALARTKTARISGKVPSADGAATNPGSLMLLSSVRSASPVSLSMGARLAANGTFEFPNVPPGQYIIRADRGRSQPWREGEFGTVAIVADGTDVSDLVVRTSAGSSISGRLVFSGVDPAKVPQPSAFELRPLAVDADIAPQSVATADIHDDWTFAMEGITGPRRLQLTRVPPGWALQEITVRGIDVTDRPLAFGGRDQALTGVEVRLTDRVTTLKGTIADADGRAAAGATVIVFATDRGRWYPMSRFLKTAVAGGDGTFTVTGLPFGSYYAVALARLPVSGDEWQDPAFLETLATRATSVTVSEAGTQPVRLNAKD